MLKSQAEAGDIVLLFQDESEALTHPYLARAWAKRGCDLRVQAPGQARKRALIGVLDCAAHKLIVSTSATKLSSDFIAFLNRLDTVYGPCPGRPDKPVVLVLDNGPIHTSKASQAALAARPWLTVEWLPKYAPELNPEEYCHGNVKTHTANAAPADRQQIRQLVDRGFARLRRRPDLLLGFIHAAGLSVKQLWLT